MHEIGEPLHHRVDLSVSRVTREWVGTQSGCGHGEWGAVAFLGSRSANDAALSEARIQMMRRHGLRGLAMALSIPGLMLFQTAARGAGVIVTVSAPGVQQTSVAGAVTETFDSLSLGSTTTIHSAFGTYTASSPGAMIVQGNAFGGSNQSQYLAVGSQSRPVTQITLNLNLPVTYFGFYFAAQDNKNNIDFYDGNSLLGTVTRGSLGLSGAYLGNPNLSNTNLGEPYAYVNVNAMAGSKITRVVFRNTGTGTGLETDNHSVSGIVPEPSSLAMVGTAVLGLGGFALRRRRRKG